MSKGSLPQFDADELKTITVKYTGLLLAEQDKRSQEALVSFFTKLDRWALSASKAGKYSCEITFPDTFKITINNELSKRGFSYKWDTYDGDTYCVVSWK